MGTRSIIKIEGAEFAEVYKHWDGNPDHMLPWLTEFNEWFTKERGDDPQYKFAQLLRRTGNPTFSAMYNLDDSPTTGWGVCAPGELGGIEFEYTLHCDGTVSWKEL